MITSARLVVGMSRGGTNIVWTSLASTEYSFLTNREINQLFSADSMGLRRKLRLETYSLGYWALSRDPFLRNTFFPRRFIPPEFFHTLVNKSVIDWINIKQPSSATLGESYSLDDLACPHSINLKLVSSWYHNPLYGLLSRNNPLKYISCIFSAFNISKLICVVRHPFAQAEAWMRRGCSETMAFKMYNFYVNYYNHLVKIDPFCNTIIVPFAEFVGDPALYVKCLLEADHIESIRIAKKPTLTNANFVNVSDKQSQLVPLSNLASFFNRDIDKVHIDSFKGSKNSALALKSLNLYHEVLERFSI